MIPEPLPIPEDPVEMLRQVARLNCARAPYGNHYKNPDCGKCTSCRVRIFLKGYVKKR